MSPSRSSKDELAGRGRPQLFFQRLRHAAEPQFMQTFECMVQQHGLISCSGLVVRRAAHVLVVGGQREFGLLLERHSVETVLEDGFHGAVAVGAAAQRPKAGRFQPLGE
jgi:hypothetical protein